MNKINSIRIFFIFIVFCTILYYQMTASDTSDDLYVDISTEQVISMESESETESYPLPVSSSVTYKYVIVEESDYLTVYFADRKTVYEYTDIRYSDLEDSLRQKIRKGYCIQDEKTLFGFLENYSS